MEIINPAMPVALNKLGYNAREIEDIVDYVMEKDVSSEYSFVKDGKIEGAPHLKPEHLPVFDTANKCGSGQRLISSPRPCGYDGGAGSPRVWLDQQNGQSSP